MMGARIQGALSSLGVRLLVPLGLVSGEAYRSSGLIRRATHDGMLLNRLEEVQTTIERLAEGPEVAAIRVYDRTGTVVLSSDRAEIGVTLPLQSAPCAACHSGVTADAPVPHEAAGRTPVGEHEVLRHLSVLQNEMECSATGCHRRPSQEAVLGVLDVEMSMLPVESTMQSARDQLIQTTLILMGVLVVLVTVLFRRLIQTPVQKLASGTKRIAAGKLDTRIEVAGNHELAHLARDFNLLVFARRSGSEMRRVNLNHHPMRSRYP